MTIQDLGSLGEFVGAVATVGTLIYLAIQIREHNLLSKRQALDTVLERATRWYEQFNQNPELLDVYLTARETFTSMEEREKWRFHTLMMPIFAMYEGGLESAKQHAVKDELVDAMKRAMWRELEFPGTRRWWDEMGADFFSHDFSKIVDDLIEENEGAA